MIETLSKEHFIDALTDSDMRLRIQQSRPYTLNDAVREAIELDAFAKAEKQRIQYGHTKPVRTTITEQCSQTKTDDILAKLLEKIEILMARQPDLDKQDRQIQPSSTMERRRKTPQVPLDQVTCYGCGEKGHYKSSCPTPQAQRKQSGN